LDMVKLGNKDNEWRLNCLHAIFDVAYTQSRRNSL
jgi:hypothetical protein